MNRRTTNLLTLLLAGPSLAGAQQQTFFATSGSFVIESGPRSAPFTVDGTGFSYSGLIALFPNPLDSTQFLPPGGPALHIPADTNDGNLSTPSLTLGGVPWGLPTNVRGDGGFAASRFTGESFVSSGPGTFFSAFTWDGFFIGVPQSVLSAHPGEDCSQLMCSSFLFEGGGTVTYDVVPYLPIPGDLQISKAIFTFKAPEPSTASLLLLGFAGLALLGHRRRLRSTVSGVA